MPNSLDLQKPRGSWHPSGSTALADETPLPAELDTCVLERTAQLERRNEELEAFTWSVSHDIKAPLSQICAYVMCLKGHPSANLDNVAHDYLDGIQSCVDRMSRLTQALLRL